MTDEFIRVCASADVAEESAVAVEVYGTPVAIVRSGGRLHAIRDSCTHADVPLSEGEIYDGIVECWLHGSCFNLRTGEATCLPATDPLAVYPLRVERGDVYVRVTRSAEDLAGNVELAGRADMAGGAGDR